MATKSLGKDLNAAQTWLNEKLLEVNICLSCLFSVMFPNYKAAGICWLHQTRKIGFPPHLSCYDEATLLYLTDAGVKVISCLLRKLN